METIVVGVLADLAMGVVAPGVHVPVRADGHVEGPSGADLHGVEDAARIRRVLDRHGHVLRAEAVITASFGYAAPGVYGAVGAQCHGVPGSCGDLDGFQAFAGVAGPVHAHGG